jgi:hypothetical protein
VICLKCGRDAETTHVCLPPQQTVPSPDWQAGYDAGYAAGYAAGWNIPYGFNCFPTNFITRNP